MLAAARRLAPVLVALTISLGLACGSSDDGIASAKGVMGDAAAKSPDLKNPFASGDTPNVDSRRAFAAELKDPFAGQPAAAAGPEPESSAARELKDPFAEQPPVGESRRAELKDPFAAQPAPRDEATAVELKDPFKPSPTSKAPAQDEERGALKDPFGP